MLGNKKMNFNVKRKALSLSDRISPVFRFANARNNLKDIYMNERICRTVQKIYNKNNNILFSNNKKVNYQNKYHTKTNSIKLIKDQLFIISHFYKNNVSNDINYDYGNSLLNTFGNRNFFTKNNEKININMFTKFSKNNNFFKTTELDYTKIRNKSKKNEKKNDDNNCLPKVNFILRKKTKF